MLDSGKTREQLLAELEAARRRIAALELEKSERQRPGFCLSDDTVRTVFEHSPIGIIIHDQRGVIVGCNQYVADLFGSPRERYLGLNLLEKLPVGRLRETLSGVVSDGQFRRYEGSYTSVVTGKTTEIQLSTAQVSPGLYVAFIEDFTERKQAAEVLRASQEALEKSECLLNRAHALAHIGGWELIPSTGAISWTRELYRIFGVSEAEYDNSDYRKNFEFVDNAWRNTLAEAFEALKNGGCPFDLELPITGADGSRRWVRAVATAEFDQGRVVRLFGNIMDITERKQAEEFHAHVERIIRHDIKAPLASLHALAQYALGGKINEEFRALVPGLMHAIHNVIMLVDSSEKLMRMDQGDYTPQATWFDLWNVRRDIELSLGPLIQAKGVRLVQAGMADSPGRHHEALFFGEEFLIEDMLLNLLKNAVEASPEGGEVRVTYRIGRNEVRIDIHNPGAVPESIRERFFEKYATAGKPDGTGLGTYSARLIARAHGGSIAYSTSEAEGTTVTVILPGASRE